MVEVWNQTPVLPTHLKQFLGKIPEEAEDVLQDLYDALWEGNDVPVDLRDWVGIPLMGEEDPRTARLVGVHVVEDGVRQAARLVLRL